MSQSTKSIRTSLESATDALEMINHAEGYEAATNGLDELSDLKHNQGDTIAAETLRWAAKELRGENV